MEIDFSDVLSAVEQAQLPFFMILVPIWRNPPAGDQEGITMSRFCVMREGDGHRSLDTVVMGGRRWHTGWACYAVENYEAGVTPNADLALPAGVYRLTRTATTVSLPSSFRGVSYVASNKNVPASRRIIVPHVGNSGADTRGCVLLVTEPGVRCGLQSRKACEAFIGHIGRMPTVCALAKVDTWIPTIS